MKICFGNTTNLRNSSTWAREIPNTAQTTICDTFLTIPHNCDKGKKITHVVAAFIAKDLRPYSVVENAGFQHLLKTLEPQYKVPSHSHFMEKVIPDLYKETRAKITATIRKASRTAITCDSWTSVAVESYEE